MRAPLLVLCKTLFDTTQYPVSIRHFLRLYSVNNRPARVELRDAAISLHRCQPGRQRGRFRGDRLRPLRRRQRCQALQRRDVVQRRQSDGT